MNATNHHANISCQSSISSHIQVEITNGISDIDLQLTQVRDVLEPHLAKMRKHRDEAIKNDGNHVNGNYSDLSDLFEKLGGLQLETDFDFDTSKFKIHETFKQMLFGDKALQNNLEQLHKECDFADFGFKGDRKGKMDILLPLLDATRRKDFVSEFHKLILNHIIPRDFEKEDFVYYQCFPCIRCVRPGEFSIGPHADNMYGFQLGNLNYYLPLTSINGSNSLALESEYGKEDWHFINSHYGQIKRFHGSLLAHFTPENKSDTTRLSFDFRIIPGSLYMNTCRYSSTPGYYVKAIKNDIESNTWIRENSHEELPTPDYRTGFPFTMK